MKRYMSMGIVVASVATGLVLLGVSHFNTGSGAPNAQRAAAQATDAPHAFPQPDTASPDWKALSDDLGLWIAKSDRVGLRGRLYVRRGDSWWPVAIDGAGDILGVVPAR